MEGEGKVGGEGSDGGGNGVGGEGEGEAEGGVFAGGVEELDGVERPGFQAVLEKLEGGGERLLQFRRGGDSLEIPEGGDLARGIGDLGFPMAPGEGVGKVVELVAGERAVQDGDMEILAGSVDGGGLPNEEIGGGEGEGKGGRLGQGGANGGGGEKKGGEKDFPRRGKIHQSFSIAWKNPRKFFHGVENAAEWRRGRHHSV